MDKIQIIKLLVNMFLISVTYKFTSFCLFIEHQGVCCSLILFIIWLVCMKLQRRNCFISIFFTQHSQLQ
jgi:hypothetical protein